MTRICVAGFGFSHNTGRACEIAASIAAALPSDYSTWFYLNSDFRAPGGLMDTVKAELSPEQKARFEKHKSAPFVWLEAGTPPTYTAIGGCDDFTAYAADKFKDIAQISKECVPPSLFSKDIWPARWGPKATDDSR